MSICLWALDYEIYFYVNIFRFWFKQLMCRDDKGRTGIMMFDFILRN